MRIEFETTIELPCDRVFAFHADPANLALLMANWRGFRLLSHSRTLAVGSVTWMVDTVGILPIALSFEQTVWEPPHRFAERMVHGPFDQFEHEHRFVALAANSTRIEDILDIAMPWYFGGGLMLEHCVFPRLRRVFAYRHGELARLAGEGIVERVTSASDELIG